METQTVATNITYLFPICELDHSQISESSGCDRRLTFFFPKPVDDLTDEEIDYGGKKRVKGNRQGVLSRSITRRSGKLQNIFFAILQTAWQKAHQGFLPSRYVYHLLWDISRRSYIPASIPHPRDDRQPSLNRTPSIGINHGRWVSTFLS